MNPQLEVREVSAEQTLVLRTQILRPGHAPDARLFGVDDAEQTRHFGAFDGAEIVGACYIVRRAAPFDSGARAWMLRGMAVETKRQGQGVGALLVRFVMDEAVGDNIEVLWFNARRIAVGFYKKLGFDVLGEEFDIPTVGPHFLMGKRLL